MIEQELIVAITVVSFVIAWVWLVWMLKRNGRNFHIMSEDGTPEIDFPLIEGILLESMFIAGLVFFVINFSVFVVWDEWVFGGGTLTSKATLIIVLIITTFTILRHIYFFARAKIKEHRITEVKKESK